MPTFNVYLMDPKSTRLRLSDPDDLQAVAARWAQCAQGRVDEKGRSVSGFVQFRGVATVFGAEPVGAGFVLGPSITAITLAEDPPGS